MATSEGAEMWRPPVNRLMRSLDRAFFRKTVDLKALRINENRNIGKCRAALVKSNDILNQDRLDSVYADPDPTRQSQGKKVIALRPEFRAVETTTESITEFNTQDGSKLADIKYVTWPHSSVVNELVEQDVGSIIPFKVDLDYSYWTYHDIMAAILPEGEQEEFPHGFTLVGHIAHLNLRDKYLKYAKLIAEILLDKNPSVETVINKIDDVGEESEYRTFSYELLAGKDDLNVLISEENCYFKFDYSKVYWNTRLNTEHRRLVDSFKEGEAVCDVMAGIGPFAVPAGKRRIFVWANDLNPESFSCLEDAIKRNKVGEYVRSFNEDGKTFIPAAIEELSRTEKAVQTKSKPPRRGQEAPAELPAEGRTYVQPKSFSHFVMNLPASAITFLPSFIGSYSPQVRERLGQDIQMPLIHVYCFSTKSDTNVEEGIKICREISQQLQFEMKPGKIEDGDVEVYDVRDVAPKKRMFCASFRLPVEVAFRTVS